MKLIFTFFLSIILFFCSRANYVTPNTGLIYTLPDLVTNSGGVVTFDGINYFIHDSVAISANDQLVINTDETLKFDANTYLRAAGTLTINPPNQVLFTSSTPGGRFLGLWVMNNSSSIVKNLTMEFANSFRIFDGNILVENCTFRNMTSPYISSFGGSAISLFRSNSTISGCSFTNNGRSAIEGGGNINNAPTIINCSFINNDILNINKPQINLGNSGPDTTKIINNYIYGGAVLSGGIAFFPFNASIPSQYLISNNIIRKNRYGITIIGGANINCRINDNIIDSNTVEGLPLNGGSGIAFNGGGLNNYQNTIVTNNIIRANLWGITIQLGSRPNLGDLSNADVTDDGGNFFIDNTNPATPGIDVYNNSPYTIMAQGNNWNTTNITEIPNHLFDAIDDITLGLIDYGLAILPVRLLNFNVTKNNNDALLSWKIADATEVQKFEIETSTEGIAFTHLSDVFPVGLSTQFNFTDFNISSGKNIYYRLKIIEKNSTYFYSEIHNLVFFTAHEIEVYPSLATENETVKLLFTAEGNKAIQVNLYNAGGAILAQKKQTSVNGRNIVDIETTNLPAGIIYIKLLNNKKVYSTQFTIIK